MPYYWWHRAEKKFFIWSVTRADVSYYIRGN